MRTRKRWVGAVVLLAAAAAGAAVIDRKSDLLAVADRVHELAVQVRARALVSIAGDKGEPEVHEATSAASGILVGGGLVLTDAGSVMLPSGDGAEPAASIGVAVGEIGILSAQVVTADLHLGVAVLRLPDAVGELPGVRFAEDPPRPGDVLIAVGAHGDSLRAVDATLAGSDRAGLHLSADLPREFRGAPLFDDHGLLVGMVERDRAVPAARLEELLAVARNARAEAR